MADQRLATNIEEAKLDEPDPAQDGNDAEAEEKRASAPTVEVEEAVE